MGRNRPAAGGRRSAAWPALVSAAVLCAAGPGAAQAPQGPTSGLELDAAATLLTPLANLAAGADDAGDLQLSSSAGLRLGAVWWLGSRLGIGLGGAWIPVDVERLASTTSGGTPVPGGKLADADYLAGVVEAVLALPPPGAGARVEPYLVGGLGLRRLSVDGDPEGAPSATDPLATVGGGFRSLLSERWMLRLEARDHLTSYDAGEDGRIQHDLSVSVGVGLHP